MSLPVWIRKNAVQRGKAESGGSKELRYDAPVVPVRNRVPSISWAACLGEPSGNWR